MKHTKEQALEIAKQTLKDIKYDYYLQDTFQVTNTEIDMYLSTQTLFPTWWVYVNCEDEQFGTDTGVLVVIIDDENLEPVQFLDGSGGRIPPFKISKKNGKYFIDGVYKY